MQNTLKQKTNQHTCTNSLTQSHMLVLIGPCMCMFELCDIIKHYLSPLLTMAEDNPVPASLACVICRVAYCAHTEHAIRIYSLTETGKYCNNANRKIYHSNINQSHGKLQLLELPDLAGKSIKEIYRLCGTRQCRTPVSLDRLCVGQVYCGIIFILDS